VDLHLHSSVSDGTDSPTELVAEAASANVSVMALVDHDILDGIEVARHAAELVGIDLIAGTELSVQHGPQKMHMLVYFLEPVNGPLQDRLAWLRPVGRPHIADALVEAGFFEIRDDAFDEVLGDGGTAYVERERLTAVAAITLARESEAVPVIAHPNTMSLRANEYSRLFHELTDAGLGGIEAHHPAHPPELRASLTETAHKLGIAATGGSDYHGAGKRDYSIATGTGDLAVPWSAVEELHEQRER
jgi:predicted metal-dependent phosphoesterase TrpH